MGEKRLALKYMWSCFPAQVWDWPEPSAASFLWLAAEAPRYPPNTQFLRTFGFGVGVGTGVGMGVGVGVGVGEGEGEGVGLGGGSGIFKLNRPATAPDRFKMR